MTLCRHASRRALQQHGLATSDHHWVSDAMLAHVFAQFERRHLRHGSSVPGPLEARRRLAKRRNMDLASTGGVGASVDIGALFGGKYVNRRNWESQLQPAAIPVYFPPSEAGDLVDVQCPQAAEEIDSTATVDVIETLKARIEQAVSVTDIESSVKDLHAHLHHQPEVSRMIFSWMLSGQKANGEKWDIADYQYFLNHPLLNVRGADNHLSVVEHLVDKVQDEEADLQGYFNLLKGSLSLGLVSASEIKQIVRLVPKIVIGSKPLTVIPDQLAACYQSLWDGLEACHVLRPRDVGSGTLNFWLRVLADTTPTTEVLSLAKSIGDVLESDVPNATHRMSDFLIRRLMTALDEMTSTQDHDNDVRGDCLIYVERVLDRFEPNVALEYVLKVTVSVLFSPNYNSRRPELLSLWSWLLRRLEGAADKILLATNWSVRAPRSTPRQVVRPVYKNKFRLPSRDRRYLRIWVSSLIGEMRSENYRKNFLPRVEILTRIVSDGQDLAPVEMRNRLAAIKNSSEGLAKLGLPSARSVLSSLNDAGSDDWEKDYADLPFLIGQEFKNLHPDFAGELNAFDGLWKYCRKNHVMNAVFTKLASEIDILDPSFIAETIRHIQADHKVRWAFPRLLQHHTPLKFALSGASRRRPDGSRGVASIGTDAQTRSTFAIAHPPPNPQSVKYPDPFKSLELLHALAFTFACAPKIRPRVAYRLTYWCYRFVIDHGGPLEPLMAKALYHSLVTRYTEAGKRIPLPKFAFVIRIIREVEGSKAANALLHRHPYFSVGRLRC